MFTFVLIPNTFNKRFQELKQILLKRKYPLKLIDNGIVCAKEINIHELQKSKSLQIRPIFYALFSTQPEKYASLEYYPLEHPANKTIPKNESNI